MRRLGYGGVWVVVALFISSWNFAQTAPATAPGDQDEHAALRALVPVYEKAANEGKPELLKPYLDPQFTGVMITGEEVNGLAGLQDYWSRIQKFLDGGTYHIKVNVAESAILSGDMAVARGTTDETVTAKGKEYKYTGQWTAVCRKQNGQWKILRTQASMDPVNNPFVQASVKQASVYGGVIAGIVGLLVGWILASMVSRKKKLPAQAG